MTEYKNRAIRIYYGINMFTYIYALYVIQTSSAQVLGSIADVCSPQLIYHFNTLVPMFAKELQGAEKALSRATVMRDTSRGEVGVGVSDTTGKVEKETEILPDSNTSPSKNKVENEDEEGEYEDVDDDDEEEEDLSFAVELEQERYDAIKESAGAVFGAVDSSGVGFLLSEVGGLIEHESDLGSRRWGCWILEQFLAKSEAEYDEYLPLMLRYLLSRVAELDTVVLTAVRVICSI